MHLKKFSITFPRSNAIDVVAYAAEVQWSCTESQTVANKKYKKKYKSDKQSETVVQADILRAVL